jgi:RNA polymerase-binding protein DksA
MDTDHFRTALLDEQKRVQDAIDYLHQETPGTLEDETEEIFGSSDNHLGDAAAGTLDRTIDYSLEANSEQLLVQIAAALDRVDAGTYGTCANCGKPIAEERLEAMPWASLCIDDQRKLEGA